MILNPKTRKSNKLGFTLVELLVVIGIIAILIGVLLPALSKARDQSKIIKCLANLQQIGVAIDLYANQCKGLMPLASERGMSLVTALPGYESSGRGRAWAGLLRDVCRVPTYLFVCPADERPDTASTTGFLVPLPADPQGNQISDSRFTFSYTIPYAGYQSKVRRIPWSLNGATYFVAPTYADKLVGPLPKSKIKRSAEVLLVYDGYTTLHSDGTSWYNNLRNTILGYATASSTSIGRITVYRHSRRAYADPGKGPNALFADGHAEQTIDVRKITEDQVTIPGVGTDIAAYKAAGATSWN